MADFFEPAPPPEPGEKQPPLRTRLAWFLALAFAGLIATAALAYTLRALLFIG